MSVMTSGAILAALRPGIHDWWGLGYKRYEEEYKNIFEVLDSSLNYERDFQMTGLGIAKVLPESVGTEYDSMQQGFHFDYIHVPYSTGFILTHQAQQDNQYMSVSEEGMQELGNSMREAKEIVAANILNRAFNSNYTYADGVQLCSTASKLATGGTYANRPAIDADISEDVLEQAIIDISQYTSDRGIKRKVMARKLIVHPNDQFEAKRILGSDLRVATANNDLNALKAMGMLPEGFFVYHYLSDSDAWFILTDAPKGLRFFNREGVRIESSVDFDTDNIKFRAYERYSVGCTDKMSIYGSQGG